MFSFLVFASLIRRKCPQRQRWRIPAACSTRTFSCPKPAITEAWRSKNNSNTSIISISSHRPRPHHHRLPYRKGLCGLKRSWIEPTFPTDHSIRPSTHWTHLVTDLIQKSMFKKNPHKTTHTRQVIRYFRFPTKTKTQYFLCFFLFVWKMNNHQGPGARVRARQCRL